MFTMVAAAAKLARWQRVRRDEVDDGVEPRHQRDLAAQELRRKMIDVRALATALHGVAGLRPSTLARRYSPAAASASRRAASNSSPGFQVGMALASATARPQ
jgi:hypothetical protein